MLEIRDETARSGLIAEIERNLLKSLQETQAQSVNSDFTLSMRDEAGELIAGLVGSTSYGWLLIKMIWVSEHHRKQGYGRALMHSAETIAKDRDCHAMRLDTSSASSHAFYQSLGFEVFGALANTARQHPPDHKRWFMARPIAD